VIIVKYGPEDVQSFLHRSPDDETARVEMRHLDQGVICMWSKEKVLSAIVGLTLFGIPLGAIAAVNLDQPSTQVTSVWRAPSQQSQILLAQENNYQWPYHHHHHVNPNNYNWGGPHRYQYSSGWFNPPPSGWATNQRRSYLEQRRQVAINMQQQMLARGDTNAAQHLGSVIGQLNRELAYR
jgi:hypothetical protein